MNLYEAIKDKNVGGEELAKVASNQVNSFLRQDEILKQILNDAEAYEEFKPVCMAFVKSLNSANAESYLHDGRNEYACRVASAIMSYDGIEPFLSITTWDGATVQAIRSKRMVVWERTTGKKADRAGEFALHMSDDHRTLQQSFASLAFECISLMMSDAGDMKFKNYMVEQFGEHWERTPMI